MAKYTGKLFSDIKDVLDENELRQQRGIAERAADRTARADKIKSYYGDTTPTGNIASRTDFSNEKMGPKFNKAVKVTKKETSVETPTGDIGSVDRTADVIGPNFAPKKDMAAEKDMDMMDKARKSMGFKKGGKVKAKPVKRMASGGKTSQLAKANGIAVKGKSRGRII